MENAQAAAELAKALPVVSSPLIETIKTAIAYVTVLVVAIVTAYAGIRKALRDLKAGEGVGVKKSEVLSATLVETYTMQAWSESNRLVVERIGDLVTRLESTVNAINYSTDVQRALCKEMSELAHQTERLRDKIN